MAVVIGLTLIAVLLIVGLVAVYALAIAPGRRTMKVELHAAGVTTALATNHLAMRDMLVDLIVLDHRGYVAVFPDEDTRVRAQALVDAYQRGTITK